MENRKKLTIDMTREGEFVDPPQKSGWPPQGPDFRAQFGGDPDATLAARLGRTAIVVAVLAGLLGAAALALIPVVLAASAVAWVAYRIQLWRMRR